MRPLAVLLVAAALAAPALALQGGLAGGWSQLILIDSTAGQPTKKFEAFDTASLNLFDFDGDGRLEIVSGNDNNRVYVLDTATGRVRAEISTTHPGGESWGARELNGIAIGNLYGDGVACLVIPNSASYLSAWCHSAANSTGGALAFDRKWEIKVDAALYEPDFAAQHPWLRSTDTPGIDGNAWLANVDDDAGLEIFVQTDGYPGQFSFDTDGSYRWSRSWFDGNAGPVVADLDGDGAKEVVFTSDSGNVACFDAATGRHRWIFDAGAYVEPGSIPVSATVADLEGDGRLEVVFGARGAKHDPEDPQWINNSHAAWFVVSAKGELVWMAQHDWMNPLTYNHPVAADVDSDGILDVLALDWNTIGHKPGSWETTNRSSNVFALSGRDGGVLWRTPVDVYWSNKDFVVADVDGDGGWEIVVNEADRDLGRDGLTLLDMATGERRGWWPLPAGWGATRGPVAADVEGDGTMEIAVPLWRRDSSPNYRSLDVGHREGAIVLIATGAPFATVHAGNVLFSDDAGREWPRGERGSPVDRAPPPEPENTTRPDSPEEWNRTPAVDEPVAPPAAGPAAGWWTTAHAWLVLLGVAAAVGAAVAGATYAVRRRPPSQEP